jgi:plastocyanin
VSRRFRRTGTYRFFCSIHGNASGGTCTGMCGRVRV